MGIVELGEILNFVSNRVYELLLEVELRFRRQILCISSDSTSELFYFLVGTQNLLFILLVQDLHDLGLIFKFESDNIFLCLVLIPALLSPYEE